MRTNLVALMVAVIALAMSGCGTAEKRASEISAERVINACEPYAGDALIYQACKEREKEAKLCVAKYASKLIRPYEAEALCRDEINNQPEKGLAVSPAVRGGLARFGDVPAYGYGSRVGEYNGYYGSGYYGNYNWPTNPTVINRIGPMFTVEGSPPTVQQTAPQRQQPTLQSRQCAINPDAARQMGINCP